MACQVCGSAVTAKDPVAYPYCRDCHYNGAAYNHKFADFMASIKTVTGMDAEIWQTGGGTMTGVIALTDAGTTGPIGMWGIMHDDGRIECTGRLSMCLWHEIGIKGEVVKYSLSQYETGSTWQFAEYLEDMWNTITSETIAERDDASQHELLSWFMFAMPHTLEVVAANRHEWDKVITF